MHSLFEISVLDSLFETEKRHNKKKFIEINIIF